MSKSISKVVRAYIYWDLMVNSAWGLLSPVFAIFLLEKIAILETKKEVTALEMDEILKLANWKARHPPLNQPHYFKDSFSLYIVVDKRHGNRTIQRKDLVKKYLTRIRESL